MYASSSRGHDSGDTYRRRNIFAQESIDRLRYPITSFESESSIAHVPKKKKNNKKPTKNLNKILYAVNIRKIRRENTHKYEIRTKQH